MKKDLFLFFAVFAMCSCSVMPVYGNYTYLQVVRDGGGSMVFDYALSASANTYDIHVTKYDFTAVDVRFQLASDGSTASSFQIIDGALSGKIQINGSAVDSSSPTGTWLSAYLINASVKDKITNADLLDSIARVEILVRENYSQ